MRHESIFATDWWMDAASGGSWGEVTRGDADQQARLLHGTRLLLGRPFRLGNPPLTPRLGPAIFHPPDAKPSSVLERTVSATLELIAGLPQHHLFVGSLDYDDLSQPWTWAGYRVEMRASQVISDITDTDLAWTSMSSSTRRAVRRAQRSVNVVVATDADGLWRQLQHTYRRQDLTPPVDRDLLSRLHLAASAKGQGEILAACDEHGQVIAAIFLVWDPHRTTYLVGGSGAEGREHRAMHLLLWTAIERSATRSTEFDFEGSMEPGIARFFRGFGGTPRTYARVTGGSRVGRAGLTARDFRQLVGRRRSGPDTGEASG